jgi:hypothetical protein
MTKTAYFQMLGFDLTKAIPFQKGVRVRCSQCEAMVINGLATHERGCPNQKHECKGCNAIIDYKGYCSDCQ